MQLVTTSRLSRWLQSAIHQDSTTEQHNDKVQAVSFTQLHFHRLMLEILMFNVLGESVYQVVSLSTGGTDVFESC